MTDNLPARFLSLLTALDRQMLQHLRDGARRPPLSDAVAWWCSGQFMGHLAPAHATWLCEHLGHCSMQAMALHWNPPAHHCLERSDALQRTLVQARELGVLGGWRGEKFSFWSSECAAPNLDSPPFLEVERAAFRYLGMLSHAVHINGFTPGGRMWFGRRSLQKSVDAGLLDNVTAGGVSAGEDLLQCATRELQEEAGVMHLPVGALRPCGSVRTSRMEQHGWHDEMLHVFNLTLPDDFEPANQDGEVAGFLCLAPADLVTRMQNHEFTLDAALVVAQSLLGQNAPTH